MTRDLLDLLSGTPQGGEALAHRLGVGRVSVHARAHALQDAGYPVEISRAGYRLAPDAPTRAALRPEGVFGAAYRYLGTVGSTQDEVRAWADAPHGAVVLAERQTAGRGRRGRTWRTPGTALTFSVLLTDGRSLPDLAWLPLAAGVALRDACGVGHLKWPNDLLAPAGPGGGGDRKLAGVLLEADVRGEEVRRAVLGVGLNVADAPEGAASLAEFRPVRRVEVLRDVLASLERWLAASPAEVLDAWRSGPNTLGREVRVQTTAGEVRGVATDLDTDGALLVRTDAGMVRVAAGDVALVSTSPTKGIS